MSSCASAVPGVAVAVAVAVAALSLATFAFDLLSASRTSALSDSDLSSFALCSFS